ncbi:MAG TPA: hypothetical protein VLL08_06850 [Kineosporiaceae bacterium]|nr:hypothetical protein [Kineosporiaceae bacterium]
MVLLPNAEPRTNTSRVRLWFPRSWTALAVFLVLAAVMVLPLLVTYFAANVLASSDYCFTSCNGPHPFTAAVAAAIGLSLALVPFAGVRFYQGRSPESAWVRLAIVVLLALAVEGAVRILGLR